jgi:hypothetical protein
LDQFSSLKTGSKMVEEPKFLFNSRWHHPKGWSRTHQKGVLS